MFTSNGRRVLYVAAGLAASAGLPQAAVAQQAGVRTAIEEVLVTARRREESLQEVPIAISAFGGEELEQRGVESIQNLNATIPNVSIMGGGATGESQGSFVVRGIPGVSTYIDGIWQSTTDGLFTLGVVEVDRIEVLRGPQGTLFGKNAVGGAIQYVTRAPADAFGARINASVGSYDRRDFSASVDLPLTDTLKTKVTVASLSRDGFVDSISIDRSYGDVNDEVLRGDVLWTPTDNFSARLMVEESDVNRNGPARVLKRLVDPVFNGTTNTNARAQAYANIGQPITNATHASNYPGGSLGKYQTRVDWENPGIVTNLTRYTLDMNYEFSDSLKLRSLSGYREHYRAVQTDFDGTEVTIIERDFRAKGRQVTQELQLLGTQERFDWVLGGYYWRDPNKTRTWTWIMTDFNNPDGTPNTALRNQAVAGGRGVTAATVNAAVTDGLNVAETEGLAFFGDLTWRMTDKFSLAAGVRYNDEDLETGAATPVVARPNFPDQYPAGNEFGVSSLGTRYKTSFDSLTSRLTLQYQWSPDVMTYIGYSEGFGAGGITVPNLVLNPDVPQQIPFEPEELTNYEIGLRADWLDGRLRTNLSAFYSEYEGIQVTAYIFSNYTAAGVFTGTQNQLPNLFTSNAGAAEVKGVEFEGTWLPTDSLRVNLSAGLLDTEYTEVGAAVSSIRVGSKFQQAPEMTANVAISYDFGLASGAAIIPRIDYTYTDDYLLATEDLRQTKQDAFGLLNARLTYDSGANWKVAVFGTNLTEEYYINSGFFSDSFLLDFVTIGRPREFGVSFDFSFQ